MLNKQKFDRVFVYMIPDSLSSFNRMKTADNINFKENLNELFSYKLVCLAYVDSQAYYFESDLKPQQYEIELIKTTEETVKEKLNKNKKGVKNNILTDINFYQIEQEFNKKQTKRKQTEELTYQIGLFLFPELEHECLIGKLYEFVSKEV